MKTTSEIFHSGQKELLFCSLSELSREFQHSPPEPGIHYLGGQVSTLADCPWEAQ